MCDPPTLCQRIRRARLRSENAPPFRHAPPWLECALLPARPVHRPNASARDQRQDQDEQDEQNDQPEE